MNIFGCCLPRAAIVILALVSSPALAQHQPGLNYTDFGVGDNQYPYLQAWGGVDLVSAHSYTSTNSGLYHNTFFYAYSPPNISFQAAQGAAVYNDTNTQSIGAFLYGENGSAATQTVWGANVIGATYGASTYAVAHGLEVNGINSSGSPSPVVDGLFIVNGGSSKTVAGLVVATSQAQPNGQADYGIMLAGPHTNYGTTTPATLTGLFIDNVTSGEAIRIQADHRIALSNSGDTYVRYNSTTDTIQLVKHNVVVAAW